MFNLDKLDKLLLHICLLLIFGEVYKSMQLPPTYLKIVDRLIRLFKPCSNLRLLSFIT